MKVAINACFGGFSLSPAALKRYAELNGRECHFFEREISTGVYTPVPEPSTLAQFSQMMLSAFDITNPNEVLAPAPLSEWRNLTGEQHREENEKFARHTIDAPSDRSDAKLIQVIEELGSEAASGACAELRIVEIPDGIEWQISEYDGMESVEEAHRSWS